VAGVRTKARRTPRGPYESLDPVEYIGAELEGLDAIDKKPGPSSCSICSSTCTTTPNT
jgi:hypothetical protein